MVSKQLSKQPINAGEARSLAIEALGLLAADAEKLSGFLALSGIGPENLRAAAQGPVFLQAVLDYICSDPSLLADIAAALDRTPAAIDHARMILAGPQPDWGA